MSARPVPREARGSGREGRRSSDLDAVTLDAYGTLLTLRDPIGHLDRELRARGVALGRDEIERGFQAEAAYYVREKVAGRDEASLRALHRGCARAFLDEVGVPLDADDFAAAFDYEYEIIPGAAETVAALAARGLALAVVANWDYSVHVQLRRHALTPYLAAVVVSAELGTAKPDPAPFHVALERLGVPPQRALHVGDDETDEAGAAAAGLRFAPAPLATAFEGWD